VVAIKSATRVASLRQAYSLTGGYFGSVVLCIPRSTCPLKTGLGRSALSTGLGGSAVIQVAACRKAADDRRCHSDR